MYWIKNDEIINIKKLSNKSIKSNIVYLRNSTRPSMFGYTIKEWVDAFDNELSYRKKLENVIINRFPYVRQKVNEVVYNIKYSDEKYKLI